MSREEEIDALVARLPVIAIISGVQVYEIPDEDPTLEVFAEEDEMFNSFDALYSRRREAIIVPHSLVLELRNAECFVKWIVRYIAEARRIMVKADSLENMEVMGHA